MNPIPYLKSILSIVLIFGFSATQANVNFQKGSYEDLQKQAGYDGKLMLVTFSAIWCAPCKVMDEYTYTNNQVADVANKNYIALKLDIDSFDGIELRMNHNIQLMPAVLVFSSTGILVGKYEKMLTAVQMLDMLKKHNQSRNRTKVDPPVIEEEAPKVHKPDVLAGKKVVKKEVEKVEVEKKAPKQEPKVEPKPQPKPEKKPEPKPEPKKETQTPSEPKPSGEPTMLNSESYTVQIGVFSTYANASRGADLYHKYFTDGLTIYEEAKNGKTVYRVMAGQFVSKGEATTFKNNLSTKGFEGYVRKWSSFSN